VKRTKKNKIGPEKITVLLCLTCAIILAAGCQQQQGGGFLRKQVLTFQKVAILPFEGDQSGQVSQCFTTSFKERFPKMEVFDQYRLLQTFPREDLYPNQLSQATRTKIGEILGAQAVVVGNVFSASITSWYLQVRVIDTQSGETLGASSVQMPGTESQGTMQACWTAVQQLMVME
jgi:TolB-like protein